MHVEVRPMQGRAGGHGSRWETGEGAFKGGRLRAELTEAAWPLGSGLCGLAH